MAFKLTFCIIIFVAVVLFASGISSVDEDEYLQTDCMMSYWLKRPVIGIDLGTSYSRVGLYQSESDAERGEVEIIADDQGNRAIPSWVAFTDNGTLIGEAAKNQSASNPERTIFDVQRLIGRKFDDPQVQEDVKTLPYKVVNKDGKPYIEVKIRDGETKVFSPEEISGMIVQKMKIIAESYLGRDIKSAVITVPANFNESQRLATKIAGAIAGFDMACIINEPTPSPISYDDAVNPDEAAAYEAAVVGWSISNNVLHLGSYIQSTSLSLGIETAGGVMRKLIPKSTVIPTKRSQAFSTYRDNQTTMLIKVYEGERALTRDCLEFGSFELSGILPAPRGVPQIEVTFDIDVNRVLHVTAQDKATNKSISITFPEETLWLTFGRQVLDKIREAVVFAVEDRDVKEKIEERNKLEAFDTTNAITDGSEFGDLVESDDKKRIEDTSREAIGWLDCNQNADMDEWKMKDLENVCSPIVKKAEENGRVESSDPKVEEDSKDEL